MSLLNKCRLLLFSRDDEKCCSWPKVALFFMVLSVTFVMLFFLIPVNSIARQIIPDIDPYKTKLANSTAMPFPSFAPSSIDSIEVVMTHMTHTTNSTNISQPQNFNSPSISPTELSSLDCSKGKLCCNGLASNCHLRLNQVMYPSLHNAMDTKEGGSLDVQNHLYPLEDAIEAGYRGIHLNVCECRGVLQFCHGVCDYAYRDPIEVFENIEDFLSRNEFEIIFLVFEVTVGDIKLDAFYDLMKTVDGFVDKMYIHKDPNKPWPKMSELLNDGKQVVAFQNGQVKKECKKEECKNVLHKYWDHCMETEYNFNSASDIFNYEKSCSIKNGLEGSKAFFNINNFVLPPKQDISAIINAKLSLSARLSNCGTKYYKLPNLVYIDYWSEGDTVNVAMDANKQLAASFQSRIGSLRG